MVGEWVGAWASSSPAPYKYLDFLQTTLERAEIWVYLVMVRRAKICTGPASSERVVWALVF